jgi:hypothetical protein
MSGTIGDGNIREDLIRRLQERKPGGASISLDERQPPTNSEGLHPQINRAYTTQVKDLSDFYLLFQKVLEAAREYDGVEYPIRFVEEFPPDETEVPCFTVKLISRMPYETKTAAEIGPRFVESFDDSDNPGSRISRFIRRQNNIVLITVWAKTNKVANDFAEWVEDRFFEFIWAFQWGGLGHPVTYLGRDEDIVSGDGEQKVHGRPLNFKIVTSKITDRRQTILRKIAIRAGIGRPEPKPSLP